jgi:hypothetical protein
VQVSECDQGIHQLRRFELMKTLTQRVCHVLLISARYAVRVHLVLFSAVELGTTASNNKPLIADISTNTTGAGPRELRAAGVMQQVWSKSSWCVTH